MARTMVSLVVATLGMGASLSASALSCDGSLYVSQGTGLTPATMELFISPAVIPVAFVSQGTSPDNYNATGYNPGNNQLYGVVNNELFLIAENGATTSLGTIANLPNVAYNSGAFSSAGVYYVKAFGNNNAIYAVDVLASPPTATVINLSASFQTSDMGWTGGLLYSTTDNGQLYAIDVSTGSTTALGSPDTTGGVLGAQFSGTNGLFGVANNGSGFFQINLTTGQRTRLSAAPSSSSNDGASCPNAAVAVTVPPVVTPPATPVPLDSPWMLLTLAGLLGIGTARLRNRMQ
ncbi:DUF6923 family protein [Comamonas piscis]